MTKLDTYLRSGAMTAKAVADAAGVSAPYLHDLRYRKRHPSDDVAARIEAATGGAVPATCWRAGEKGDAA